MEEINKKENELFDIILKKAKYFCEQNWLKDNNLGPESKEALQRFSLIPQNPEKLAKKYFDKISELANNLCSKENTTKQNILNVLEWVRLNIMYENHDNKTHKFHQHPFPAIFTGKSVCRGIAQVVTDILSLAGYEVFARNYPFGEEGRHAVSLLKEGKDYIFLDPTNYNGCLESETGLYSKEIHTGLYDDNGKESITSINDYFDVSVIPFKVSQEEIVSARKIAMKETLNNLPLTETERSIVNKDYSLTDYIYYVNSLIRKQTVKEDFTINNKGLSVCVGEKIFDRKIALELFMTIKGIDYEIKPSTPDGKSFRTGVVCEIPLDYKGEVTKIWGADTGLFTNNATLRSDWISKKQCENLCQ